MKLFVVVVVLATLVMLTVSMGIPNRKKIECEKPNEVWDDCHGCGFTCDDVIAKRQSKVCTLECRIGCHCKPGFYRNHNGECVRAADCPEVVSYSI
ncbi:hypothetical protein QR680_006233 [Steinernema hermaphroditum]|uniref:TIL domain-containing protein n=1 Tax=Steinernema hermaphroditum TaxID=289476 RepID=A0AA39HX66_9BILA|nr:hypothetical protein QR680_006233 [Steinernema hermaphroditum]